MKTLRAASWSVLFACAACGGPPRPAPSATVTLPPPTPERLPAPSSDPAPPSSPPPTASSAQAPPPPSTAEEIDRAILTLLDPHGGPGHNYAKGEAFAVLKEHPDLATEKLLTLAQGVDPNVNVLLALGRLGREESVAALARTLETAAALTTVIAAQALGEHPSPRALGALEQALTSSRAQVVVSAALALADRGDHASCSALRAVAKHPDAEVRGRIAQARRQMGCR